MKHSHFIRGMFLVLLAATSFLLTPSLALAGKDNPKCEKNPLFSPFPSEYIYDCERSTYQSISLYRYKDPLIKDDIEPFNVEGEYWNYTNNVENDSKGRGRSALELRKNFENAITKAHGEILYISTGSNNIYYRITRKDGEFWGSVGTGDNRVEHSMVRLEPMTQEVGVIGEPIDSSPSSNVHTVIRPSIKKPLVIPPLLNVTRLHERLNGKKISLGEGLSFDLHRFVTETSFLTHPNLKRVFEPSFQQRYLSGPVSYSEDVQEMSDRVVVTRTLILDTKDPCDPGLEQEGFAFCFKPSGKELSCGNDAKPVSKTGLIDRTKNLFDKQAAGNPASAAERDKASCEAKAHLAKVRDKVRARLAAAPRDPEANRLAGYLQMDDLQLMDHLLNKESTRKTVTLTSVVPYLAYEFRKVPDDDVFNYSRPLSRANLFKLPPPTQVSNGNMDRFRTGIPRNADGTATMPAAVFGPIIESFSPANGKHGEPITVIGNRMDKVVEVALTSGAERYPQEILNRGPTHITMSNYAPAGSNNISLLWSGGKVDSAQPYTVTFQPIADIPPAPGPYEWDHTRHIEAKLLTGFTWGRSFGNRYVVEFAEETWASDRYYASFSYRFSAGFGMRWPFKVSIDTEIDKVYSGDDNQIVNYPSDRICKGDFFTEGDEAKKNAFLCGHSAKVSMKAEPVDGDADFYRDTGLPDEKVFAGKEFVLELGLTCNLYASIPGPNISLHCPSALSGFDLGQNYPPQLGSTSSEFMKFFLPGRKMGLAIDLGLGYAAFNPGVIAQGDNGVLKLDLLGLSSTPSLSTVDLQTGTKSITVSENNARGAWGVAIANPRYSVDVSLKPAVELELGLDLIAFSWKKTFPPISIDAVALDLGRQEYEQHEATNGSYRLRDIGMRPAPPPPPR